MAEPAPLRNFPHDVANNLGDMTRAFAWYAANKRTGFEVDAARDKINFDKKGEDLEISGQGLGLCDASWAAIRWLVRHCAWEAANTIAEWSRPDVAHNKIKKEDLCSTLKSLREMTDELVDNICNFASHTASSTTHERQEQLVESVRSSRLAETAFATIGAPAEMQGITFGTPVVETAGERTPVGQEMTLKNPSVHVANIQKVTWEVTQAISTTLSSTHKVGFKVNASSEVKAKFDFLVEAKINGSFEASYKYIWSSKKGESNSTRRSIEATCCGGKKIVVQCTMYSSTVIVPYTATIEIAGVTREIPGKWHGVVGGGIHVETISEEECSFGGP